MRGVGTGDYVDFRFLDYATAETRTTITSVPVNNIIDNLSWTKGKHTLQIGGNWRLIHQNHSPTPTPYNSASTNPYWLGGNPPDPAAIGAPGSEWRLRQLLRDRLCQPGGHHPAVTNVYQLQVTSATSGIAAGGRRIHRSPLSKPMNSSGIVQDAWRVTPNLTSPSAFATPSCRLPRRPSGQQVAPTIDTHAWFLQRESAARGRPDLRSRSSLRARRPLLQQAWLLAQVEGQLRSSVRHRLLARHQDLNSPWRRHLLRPLRRSPRQHLRPEWLVRYEFLG